MVQTYSSPIRVYKYPFELLLMAYERRFPTCPQMPIVLDCVVTEDSQEDNGAKRLTKRRCKLAVEAPYVLKKLVGIDVAFFIQTNILNMRERTLTIEATNETFSSKIKIFERCRYYVHPENPMWTCFDQTANIDITNFFGFEHAMEKFGMKQYTHTTLKGKEIMEFFITQLKEEGITHVDRWPEAISPVEEQAELKSPEKNDEKRKNSQHEDARLDADYISKYLGNLSPLQESKLVQFRKKMEGHDLEKIPDYPTLLRFLRARDFSIEKSSNMLLESLKWRKENKIDTLLKDYKTPAVVQKYFPGAWHENDNDGRPTYILRLGHMDVKGLLKAMGEDGLLKLTLHICEEGLKKMEEQTNKYERPIWNWCLLVDLEGLCMRHLWRPGVKALLRIIETVEKNYPETMGRVLILRAPRVFPILWTIVSAFIDENTRSKFLFLGEHEKSIPTETALKDYIPTIPDFLGGTSKTLIHEGSIVPKTLYKNDSIDQYDGKESNGDIKLNLNENLYKSVNLKPGQIFEIIINNDDPKSVLTWDFESIKSEIIFTIFKTDVDIKEIKDDYTSIFDLSGMEENVNYSKIEPTHTYKLKESVQGSLEMESKGNYIMQWLPSPCNTSNTELIYFHEILSSANYKGSMTSLSALSAASSCQSR